MYFVIAMLVRHTQAAVLLFPWYLSFNVQEFQIAIMISEADKSVLIQHQYPQVCFFWQVATIWHLLHLLTSMPQLQIRYCRELLVIFNYY